MTSRIPKPVTIITGFLGAGKTTFLNALLEYYRHRKFAIVENEFGQEGIDGELVIGADGSVFEMSDGCLCCSLNEDLVELLVSLTKRHREFDELIVETTGIADPASVALPFLTEPLIGRYFGLQRVICLVDARLIEKELAGTEEARRQISFSDLLLITKTDLVPPAYLEQLKALLANINPFATVLTGNKDEYPIDMIMQWKRDQAVDTVPPPPAHHHHHEHHHHDLSSLSFIFTEPFDIEKLGHALMVFLAVQARDVYRVKGIIHAEGHEEKIVVQSVADLLSISEGKPWNGREERSSRLVFIGKDLQSKGFEKLLGQCLIPQSPTAGSR